MEGACLFARTPSVFAGIPPQWPIAFREPLPHRVTGGAVRAKSGAVDEANAAAADGLLLRTRHSPNLQMFIFPGHGRG